jgi:hypothetical protein
VKIPLGYAYSALLLACILGYRLGIQWAGPMPVLVHDAPEPEMNYTLETLRALQPPPAPVVVHHETASQCGGGGVWGATAFASMVYFNCSDVRR